MKGPLKTEYFPRIVEKGKSRDPMLMMTLKGKGATYERPRQLPRHKLSQGHHSHKKAYYLLRTCCESLTLSPKL